MRNSTERINIPKLPQYWQIEEQTSLTSSLFNVPTYPPNNRLSPSIWLHSSLSSLFLLDLPPRAHLPPLLVSVASRPLTKCLVTKKNLLLGLAVWLTPAIPKLRKTRTRGSQSPRHLPSRSTWSSVTVLKWIVFAGRNFGKSGQDKRHESTW